MDLSSIKQRILAFQGERIGDSRLIMVCAFVGAVVLATALVLLAHFWSERKKHSRKTRRVRKLTRATHRTSDHTRVEGSRRTSTGSLPAA